jgi:hypothetical protein
MGTKSKWDIKMRRQQEGSKKGKNTRERDVAMNTFTWLLAKT